MKALSLTQPWALLSVHGLKKIETRSWSTSFRGTFAIHASKGFPRWAKDLCLDEPHFSYALQSLGSKSPADLPIGAIVGVVDLNVCLPVYGKYKWLEKINGKVTTDIDYRKPDEHTAEFSFGDYSAGRFMYFMENARALKEPIPCKGALSFWNVPSDIEAQILDQLK